MKKIISLVLLAAIALFALASCAPAEKGYTLAIGMSVSSNYSEDNTAILMGNELL